VDPSFSLHLALAIGVDQAGEVEVVHGMGPS
jgi:hypothetical protein